MRLKRPQVRGERGGPCPLALLSLSPLLDLQLLSALLLRVQLPRPFQVEIWGWRRRRRRRWLRRRGKRLRRRLRLPSQIRRGRRWVPFLERRLEALHVGAQRGVGVGSPRERRGGGGGRALLVATAPLAKRTARRCGDSPPPPRPAQREHVPEPPAQGAAPRGQDAPSAPDEPAPMALLGLVPILRGQAPPARAAAVGSLPCQPWRGTVDPAAPHGAGVAQPRLCRAQPQERRRPLTLSPPPQQRQRTATSPRRGADTNQAAGVAHHPPPHNRISAPLEACRRHASPCELVPLPERRPRP